MSDSLRDNVAIGRLHQIGPPERGRPGPRPLLVKARAVARQLLEPLYGKSTGLKKTLRSIDASLDRVRHAAALRLPVLIQPDPRRLYITLTANCDQRCKGCRYGRDFMPGHELPLQIVRNLVDDAKALGFERVRLYGGEPLLYKELPAVVEHIADAGLKMWLTTNGFLLKRRVDDLYRAGLRHIALGFYGLGDGYDEYAQVTNRFARIEESVAYVRDRYGPDITLQMDWLLMKPTSDLETVRGTLEFAERYEMPIYTNLIHYSLPYFTDASNFELQFTPADRPVIERAVEELLRFRERRPDLMLNSAVGLRSIPDWLLLGPAMRVPCSEYRLIWIGADGTVQMCYVTFELGNLHQKRLAEMLFTPEHKQAARDAFQLNCPNCHCSYDDRTLRHTPARRRYA